jgi:hypothetical protein
MVGTMLAATSGAAAHVTVTNDQVVEIGLPEEHSTV